MLPDESGKQIAILVEEVKYMRGDLKCLTELLTGNGAPERGLVVRVDRLERQVKNNDRWIDRIISAVIAALVAAGFGFLFPHRG